MPGRTITVAQQKGGAGKTTLVCHLAVAFATRGLGVGLLDVDPQGSLSAWLEVRAARTGGTAFAHAKIAGWRVQAEVERFVKRHDLVLVDSPPHAATDAKVAIRAADLVLIPIQPSPMDLWATRPTLDLARAENVPAVIVLNRVPARSRSAETLAARIADLGAAVAAVRLGSRAGFAAAMLDGAAVQETEPASKSAAEIAALADEILARL
jgi:chromosome partitioning protein